MSVGKSGSDQGEIWAAIIRRVAHEEREAFIRRSTIRVADRDRGIDLCDKLSRAAGYIAAGTKDVDHSRGSSKHDAAARHPQASARPKWYCSRGCSQCCQLR